MKKTRLSEKKKTELGREGFINILFSFSKSELVCTKQIMHVSYHVSLNLAKFVGQRDLSD